MLAGVVSLGGASLPRGVRDELRTALSRFPGEELHESDHPNAFFARANTAALHTYPGLRNSGPGTAGLLAGEPLISGSGVAEDHRLLDEALATGDLSALESARGVFCGASFREDSLILYSDKLGIRPLYYWRSGDLVVFASALRILRDLSFVPLQRDLRGVSETVGFGYPLADRTAYRDVRVAREAELIHFDPITTRSTTYWKWADIHPAPLTEVVEDSAKIFREAIEIRLQGDPDAIAFVSGGMDSRAIVGVLSDLGISLQGLTFARENSQNRVFARDFAAVAGLEKFFEISPDPSDKEGFRLVLADKVKERIATGELSATRSRAPWSGDGGSVSLGCVYLDDRVVELIQKGARREAFDYFFDYNTLRLPLRAMGGRARRENADLLQRGIEEELARLDGVEPGQALFLFLMFNDQRRHLHDVYEDLDLHRLEYQLPFFDSALLEKVFAAPLEERLNHRFYTKWFDQLPEVVRSVPWQTYPGHVPCPLEVRDDLEYQWGPGRRVGIADRIASQLRVGGSCLSLILSGRNIGPISRWRLFAACVAHFIGLRDYEYLSSAASRYADADDGRATN